MIAVSQEAASHLRAFERFYIEKQRPQALRNLGHALAEASLTIVQAPEKGASFPKPYPDLQALGLLWIKRGRYWFAYDPDRLNIAVVFFDTDDISRRFGE